MDIARITKEESEIAVTILERARDEGVIVEMFSNPKLYAFPHVYGSSEAYKNKKRVNTENGKKGGRPKVKQSEGTGETDSALEDSLYSFKTKNGIERISEGDISSFQREFPSLDIMDSLERFKSWYENENRNISTTIECFLRTIWFVNDKAKQNNPSFTSYPRGTRNNRSMEPYKYIEAEDAGL